MSPPRPLAVIGNIVLDVLVHPLAHWPDPGRAAEADAVTLAPGGCGFHTAATAATLRVGTHLLGSIGRDAAAGTILEEAARYRYMGVDGVGQLARYPTTVTVVTIRPDGERSFLITNSAAAARFAPGPRVQQQLDEVEHLHLAGFGLLPRVTGVAGARLLARAKQRGIRTSLDLAWSESVDPRTALDPLLPHLDMVCPNLDEGRSVSGRERPEDVAAWFHDRGVGTVYLTRGEDGVFVSTVEGAWEVAAYPGAVVDTTGAGDAFAGGVLAATLDPRIVPAARARQVPPPLVPVLAGSAAGSLACAGVGGAAGPRSRRQLVDRIHREPLPRIHSRRSR